MRIVELEEIAERLDEPAHLVVWQAANHFEVIAVAGDGFEDAFPLPMPVQEAAAEAGLILDTSTAARLEIARMPDDFWNDLEEVEYEGSLRVSMLGRSGAKYLRVFHAVRESGGDESGGDDFRLAGEELLKVARWLREEALFDHRSGDVMMEVLTRLAK